MQARCGNGLCLCTRLSRFLAVSTHSAYLPRILKGRTPRRRYGAIEDSKVLIGVGIAEARGSGRARHYTYKGAG